MLRGCGGDHWAGGRAGAGRNTLRASEQRAFENAEAPLTVANQGSQLTGVQHCQRAFRVLAVGVASGFVFRPRTRAHRNYVNRNIINARVAKPAPGASNYRYLRKKEQYLSVTATRKPRGTEGAGATLPRRPYGRCVLGCVRFPTATTNRCETDVSL